MDGWGGGLHPSIAGHLPSPLLVQDSGQSPRDSLSNEETPRTSQVRPGNGGRRVQQEEEWSQPPGWGGLGAVTPWEKSPSPGQHRPQDPPFLSVTRVLSGPAHVPVAVGRCLGGHTSSPGLVLFQVSSQSDLEQSTPEPNSLQESLGEWPPWCTPCMLTALLVSLPASVPH